MLHIPYNLCKKGQQLNIQVVSAEIVSADSRNVCNGCLRISDAGAHTTLTCNRCVHYLSKADERLGPKLTYLRLSQPCILRRCRVGRPRQCTIWWPRKWRNRGFEMVGMQPSSCIYEQSCDRTHCFDTNDLRSHWHCIIP